MRNAIGIPKETKQNEGRVGLTPDAVRYVRHKLNPYVLVESGAGALSGFSDKDYINAGATLVDDVWAENPTLIVKVKEPQQSEYSKIVERQNIFGYFHFASNKNLVIELCARKVGAYAYETLEDKGRLPLLDPMSDIAGRVCIQRGSTFLPMLLGGVPGTKKSNVLVVGAGVVGTSAATMAKNMGARVTVADIDPQRLVQFEREGYETLFLPLGKLTKGMLRGRNMLVGAVHVVGKKTPHIVDEETLQELGRGLFIDVSIDQGGCSSVSKPTTHDDPIYKVGDVTCYCVANLPGAVPRTSSEALSNASMKYVADLMIHLSHTVIAPSPCTPALMGGEVLDQRILDTFPQIQEEVNPPPHESDESEETTDV